MSARQVAWSFVTVFARRKTSKAAMQDLSSSEQLNRLGCLFALRTKYTMGWIDARTSFLDASIEGVTKAPCLNKEDFESKIKELLATLK